MPYNALAIRHVRTTCCLGTIQLLLISFLMLHVHNHVEANPTIVSSTVATNGTDETMDKFNATELIRKSHVKARILDDTLAGPRVDATEPKDDHAMPTWTESSKQFVYDEGFFMRFMVVIFLMMVVALVLMFVRTLRNNGKANGVYGAIPNNFTDEKASLQKFTALNNGAYEDDDDDEVSVFDASQHKLLSKDRRI